ncbi:MAG: hypothetical protein IPK00_19110 [Deltaproteobacteria bacterium]|nr:hypothetical protein [Deltaproteobacteria bacterium]
MIAAAKPQAVARKASPSCSARGSAAPPAAPAIAPASAAASRRVAEQGHAGDQAEECAEHADPEKEARQDRQQAAARPDRQERLVLEHVEQTDRRAPGSLGELGQRPAPLELRELPLQRRVAQPLAQRPALRRLALGFILVERVAQPSLEEVEPRHAHDRRQEDRERDRDDEGRDRPQRPAGRRVVGPEDLGESGGVAHRTVLPDFEIGLRDRSAMESQP